MTVTKLSIQFLPKLWTTKGLWAYIQCMDSYNEHNPMGPVVCEISRGQTHTRPPHRLIMRRCWHFCLHFTSALKKTPEKINARIWKNSKYFLYCSSASCGQFTQWKRSNMRLPRFRHPELEEEGDRDVRWAAARGRPVIAVLCVSPSASKLPPLTVAVLCLLGVIAFMLLLCLLSCVYRMHERKEKSKKLTLLAQQADKGGGEAFRQVTSTPCTTATVTEERSGGPRGITSSCVCAC